MNCSSEKLYSDVLDDFGIVCILCVRTRDWCVCVCVCIFCRFAEWIVQMNRFERIMYNWHALIEDKVCRTYKIKCIDRFLLYFCTSLVPDLRPLCGFSCRWSKNVTVLIMNRFVDRVTCGDHWNHQTIDDYKTICMVCVCVCMCHRMHCTQCQTKQSILRPVQCSQLKAINMLLLLLLLLLLIILLFRFSHSVGLFCTSFNGDFTECTHHFCSSINFRSEMETMNKTHVRRKVHCTANNINCRPSTDKSAFASAIFRWPRTKQKKNWNENKRN